MVHTETRRKFDVLCRKLLRQIVGPLFGIDWSIPWHEILHAWHERLYEIMGDIRVALWSERWLRHHWRFAGYVANLPPDRWLIRVLGWTPNGTRMPGRPRKAWDEDIASFCKAFGLGSWRDAAKDPNAWTSLVEDFLSYMSPS